MRFPLRKFPQKLQYAITCRELKSGLQLKVQGNIQLDTKTPAQIVNAHSAGGQVLRQVFQATEMILIGHIAHICNGQVYTKKGVSFFIAKISTRAQVHQ